MLLLQDIAKRLPTRVLAALPDEYLQLQAQYLRKPQETDDRAKSYVINSPEYKALRHLTKKKKKSFVGNALGASLTCFVMAATSPVFVASKVKEMANSIE